MHLRLGISPPSRCKGKNKFLKPKDFQEKISKKTENSLENTITLQIIKLHTYPAFVQNLVVSKIFCTFAVKLLKIDDLNSIDRLNKPYT